MIPASRVLSERPPAREQVTASGSGPSSGIKAVRSMFVDLFRILCIAALSALSLSGAAEPAGAQSRGGPVLGLETVPAAGPGVVAVNAPDGPTLEVREAMQRARDLALPSLTIKLQNTSVIQDADLMLLIIAELFDLVAEYGYSYNQITMIQCPTTC